MSDTDGLSIPDSVLEKLNKRGIKSSDIRLKTTADLDFYGNPSVIWVFATETKILVIPETGLQEELEFELSRIKRFRIRASVGSAYLQARVDDFFIELVRFTNALRYRFSRLIVQLDLLRQGKPVSDEYINEPHPMTCPVCGLPLQTEKATCPKCARQGPIMFRVLYLLEPYLHWVIIVLLLMFISVALNLLPPKLTQILVDEVLTTRRHVDWLVWIVVALVAAELMRALINMVVGTLTTSIGTLITFDLRKKLFTKLQGLSVDYYDQQSVGTLMTRFSSDVEAFHGFITQAGQGFLLNMFLIAGIGIMLFFLNARLAFFVLIPVPLVLFGTYFFWNKIYPMYFKFWDSQSKISRFLNTVLSGIKVVKAFAQEDKEIKRFEKMANDLKDANRRVNINVAKFNPLMAFLFSTGGLIVWYAGGKTVLANTGFTLGQLMAFLSYTGMFYAPLSQMALMSNWVSSFVTASHRIFEILDTEPQLKDAPNAIRMPRIEGHIRFEHVTFGYDPYQPIIKDVSFEIEPGRLVGIVGKSGSGKTTLVNLICRFYDVQEGAVYIDGKDIRDISSYDLRRQIGLVLQEPFLFRGSIAENISYGRPDASFKEILNAAKAANCHDFIMKLPNGYDTQLREHGSGISGGEKQRIGIARALLCDPPILILDEATSSVDTESEKKIQDALDVLCRNRTTIAIAHRLSTLRGADKIFVVDNGRIAESGTHKELLDMKGIYYRLVMMQTKLTSIETEVG
ncbi:MAG TPA: ABC transporter ATP-binding protein [Candidatus Ratteibacteria bacterium]|uniref:Multidrug export ATP-binding/permease protein n=1 Tax=candidate division TA06 bacterium ADurb.Bin131 TaxID=1852827 RepID=A0A1V6C5G0_UNCT6|nr:MAG: putative multidrug export ATP-binding/permease protein [candidate division TA06 bacterium ADurb.Bin131]HON06159.1 ABC transporter ATP-binding protein [bacterium]HRS07043.1 ABC transporter ATP-binding protein [Candidatus Ratteibacteria bacterium]